jgi:hypothetical protein
LGVQLGAPWTLCSAWLPDTAVQSLEPEALRFAWQTRGHPSRVAVVVEWIACGALNCTQCGGCAYTHGPFAYEYLRTRMGLDRQRLASLAPRSQPPTFRDALQLALDWRYKCEAARARQRSMDPTCQYHEQQNHSHTNANRHAHHDLEDARKLFGFGAGTYTREDIKRVHRKLARIEHPDKGGDVARMARVNRARDILIHELDLAAPKK